MQLRNLPVDVLQIGAWKRGALDGITAAPMLVSFISLTSPLKTTGFCCVFHVSLELDLYRVFAF